MQTYLVVMRVGGDIGNEKGSFGVDPDGGNGDIVRGEGGAEEVSDDSDGEKGREAEEDDDFGGRRGVVMVMKPCCCCWRCSHWYIWLAWNTSMKEALELFIYVCCVEAAKRKRERRSEIGWQRKQLLAPMVLYFCFC